LATKANEAGSGDVHAASINVGSTPQERLIECEVTNKDALTQYPLKVPGTGETATPETSETATEDPSTGDDQTAESTAPTVTATTTRTPAGGVQTGGGGTAGPDGRVLVAVGSLVILASFTGLLLRRRKRVAIL
jgi:hypothetical protein